MITYKHPQGKVVVVHDNGTMTCTKNGKPATTSATPEKLAAGRGGWVQVESADEPPPPMPDAPTAGFVIRQPMRFAQATQDLVLEAVHDDRWWFQQKLDGIRAQLVIGNGIAWARASTGGSLKSTAAGPVAKKVIDSVLDHSEPIILDGEIISGAWWMFDILMGEDDRSGYAERYRFLTTYIEKAGLSPAVRLLPTAQTSTEKAGLLERVIESGGEGVLIKRRDSTYDWGRRVEHSLKFKITHTVDCVVTARNGSDHMNATLGLYETPKSVLPVTIGNASMIGKPDAKVGDVVEVRYLYAGAGGRLVQPTVLRKRTDKYPPDCLMDQLVFVNKEVLT